MNDKKKNKIGAIGFGVILLGAGAYGAYAYWPVEWTKDGKILKADLAGMDPIDVREKVGKLDLNRLSDAQREGLSQKLRDYVDELPREQRREFFGPGGFMGFGAGTQPADPATKNMQELFSAAREKVALDFAKASQEERNKILDKMLDEMQERRNRASTRASTRPGGATGGGGGGGGRWGGGATAGAGGGNRQGPNPARMAARVADRLQNGTAEQRAANRLMHDQLAARAKERGIPWPAGGGMGGGPR